MERLRTFQKSDIQAMAPLEKIGLYATINPDGMPHITFVNSLMASSENELTFGQFVRGNSKWFMQLNPKTAFFILAPLQKKMWFGTALWKAKKDDGPQLDTYKAMPMQRYNSYFPIYRVHYLDLVKTTKALKIPILPILTSVLAALAAKPGARTYIKKRVMNPYSEKLFNRLNTLKFMAFKGSDGFPVLIPVFGTFAADSRRIVFHAGPYGNIMDALQDGQEIAAFALSTNLENVLVRGEFSGFRKRTGLRTGVIDINWVYNSMPPNAGQIYPDIPLVPVTDF
jgi:hypothetical protein